LDALLALFCAGIALLISTFIGIAFLISGSTGIARRISGDRATDGFERVTRAREGPASAFTVVFYGLKIFRLQNRATLRNALQILDCRNTQRLQLCATL
jgi:hypothetical protein